MNHPDRTAPWSVRRVVGRTLLLGLVMLSLLAGAFGQGVAPAAAASPGPVLA